MTFKVSLYSFFLCSSLFFADQSFTLQKEIAHLDPLTWFSSFSAEAKEFSLPEQQDFLKIKLAALKNHLEELVQDISESEFNLLERDFYSESWVNIRAHDQKDLSIYDKQLYATLELMIKATLSKERQKRIDLEIVESFFENKSQSKALPVLSAEEFENLDIIHSNNKKPSINTILSPTKTYFGRLRRVDMITHPLIDSSIILSRQKSIKEIVNNKEMRILLGTHLGKIGLSSSSLLSYFGKKSSTHNALENFYFSSSLTKPLNNKPLALEAYKALSTASNVAYLGALIGFQPIKSYAEYYALSWRAKTVAEARGNDGFSHYTTSNWGEVLTSSFLGPIKNCLNNLNPFPRSFAGTLTYEKRKEVYNDSTASMNLTHGDKIKEQSFLFFHDNQQLLKYAIPAGLALCTYIALYNSYKKWGTDIKESVNWILGKNDPIHLIKEDLKAVSSIIESFDLISQELSLHKACKENSELAPFTQKEGLYKENYTKIAQLKKLLASDSIQKPSLWKPAAGQVLVAHKLLQEIKDSFIPFFKALGELDVYLSLAESIVAQTNSDTKFCFVTFSKEKKPIIELDNFWHPVATKTAPVTNTLHLGGNSSPYGIILTGPNNCGKSTSMKAVSLNLILAQTFGIAAAEKAHLSIFSRIHTYINNSQDDINNGWGAFKAEKEKVASILQSVKEVPTEQFSFNILDEAFKGTVGDECEERVFNFGKTLSESSNTLSIFATHGKFPMTLEEHTHGLYQNYQVELIEKAPGEFIRTHKLIRSTSNWWFDDKAKRQRFLDTV